MSSIAVPNSITNNSNDIVDDLVLNIENLLQDFQALPISDEAVCVYRVPQSLSSAKPEAYTPQFVGLGPYHHRRPEVIPREILKVAAATRVLKYFNRIQLKEFVEDLRNLNHLAPFIRDCYDGSIESNDFTLVYLMTVDALFLYDLLCRLVIEKQSDDGTVTKCDLPDSILTRKLGMPLVNAAGVELTKDAIIRDIFMLENQIPTCIIKQIMTVLTTSMEPEVPHLNVDDEYVGSRMVDFCRALCPLLQIQQLPNKSEAVKRVHLLDLVYHLIVPEPKSEPKPEPMDKQPEKKHAKSRRCCYIVVPPLIFSYVLVFYILDLMSWTVDTIYYPIVQLVTLIFSSPAVDKLHECLNGISYLRPLAIVVGGIKGAVKLCKVVSPNSDTSDASLAVTIASVTQLHKVGIHFQPADGGITSIKFDEGIFYLPKIRVDVNSEVIIRNLVAYESLTKSNRLIFTKYVELMRAIIDTAEDVKLLVTEEIIKTELSDEQVAQLFNGSCKSIRLTNTPELDDIIKKVKAKFDDTTDQKLHRIYTTYVLILFKWGVVYAVLILLVLMVMQAYCFVFSCSRTSKFGKLPEDGYEYRNNYFINSM